MDDAIAENALGEIDHYDEEALIGWIQPDNPDAVDDSERIMFRVIDGNKNYYYRGDRVRFDVVCRRGDLVAVNIRDEDGSDW